MISPEGTPGPIETVLRPFAMIGRAPDADVWIDHPDASLRHVYLHLDRRGVFAVDLASRTGVRFDDDTRAGRRAGWLRPGQGLELAGHRVELIEAVLNGPELNSVSVPEAEPGDPLAEAVAAPLARLDLVPADRPDHPQTIVSELAFVGRSRRCAVRIDAPGIARVHGVIVRTVSAAFLVDLIGGNLTINGQTVGRVLPVADGDVLAIGRSRFTVRLGPAPTAIAPPSPVALAIDRVAPATPPELREAVIAWVLQAIHAGQGELARRQNQFQDAMIEAVRQLGREQNDRLQAHLDRMDALHSELADLRAELYRRLGPEATPKPSTALDAPPVPPLDIPRETPAASSGASGKATSWLLDRVRDLEGQVEREGRSAWRDLLAQFGSPAR